MQHQTCLLLSAFGSIPGHSVMGHSALNLLDCFTWQIVFAIINTSPSEVNNVITST